MEVGVYWQDRYRDPPHIRAALGDLSARPKKADTLARCSDSLAKRYSDAVRYIFDSNQTVASNELWHKRWISYSAAAAKIPAIKTVNATANHTSSG